MSSEHDDPLADPAVFDVVGHEIRLATIEALAERRREAWLPKGLPFAELCDAVGVDDTGQFNYHLGKLRGTYVEEHDGTYVLTNAGFEIAGALRAGTFGDDDLERRDRLDQTCYVCDDRLEAVYEHGYLRIACPTHGPVLSATLPPAAVRGRDIDAIVDLAQAHSTDTVNRVKAGGCPHCWGHATVTVPATPSREYLEYHWDGSDDEDRHQDDHGQVIVEAACGDCGLTFWLPVSVVVSDHPAVVAYYFEHDVDPDYLDLPHVDGENGTVIDRDPVRVEVAVHAQDADDALIVTVDGSASVVDHRREPVDSRDQATHGN
jgi:hypothetical protein